MKRKATKRNAPAKRRGRPRRKLTAKMLRPYAKLFGGKIPPGAMRQIAKEYGALKNPGPGAFKRCVESVAARGGAWSPSGVCASAGRKKYGAKKFAAMASAGRRKARRNPVEAAAAKYREFHGRDPEEVIEIESVEHVHSVLSGIGKLEFLKILAPDRTEVTLNGFKGALLAMDENGRQLFVEGGDQSVNLADFGIRHRPHEREFLGACTEIGYVTRKDHLGKAGGEGERALHVHKFGDLDEIDAADPRRKSGSALPIVVYDVRNKRLSFAGGGYDLPEVGIRG